MLPYKIRPPARGSLKSNSKPTKSVDRRNAGTTPVAFDAASHLGGDPDDSHTVGGNLQRAILLDLIELRQRYFDVESSTLSSGVQASGGATAGSPTSTATVAAAPTSPRGKTHTHHAALGSSFGRFKECFREARFGAIHTRTIPPRVDRGEYVQLLYSSCFYLLEESFKCSSRGDAGPLRWDDNSHPNSAFNAIYAAFILYTLHQTNVLPEAPPPRSRTKLTKSGKFNERSLQEAWSMLPIGINSDEDKLYRRTFRFGVRIDRWNYMLLIQLRDLCLARVGSCAVDEVERWTTNTTAALCDNMPWGCHCGLARDAAHAVDKMLFDDKFFEYCEYHGPHSLEGLAGSPHFYKTYFVKPPAKAKRSKKNNAASAPPSMPAAMSQLELNTVRNADRISDSLDLQNLSYLVDNHRSNLNSVMAQLQRSRLPGGDLQPKQRELVENTLGGTMEQSTNYLKLMEKLNANKVAKAGVSNTPEVKHMESKQELLLTFPEKFSPALCDQIRGALFDFKEEADIIRKAVVKEHQVLMKEDMLQNNSDMYPELACFDDLDTVAHEQTSLPSKMASGNAILSTSTHHLKRKCQREFDTFFDLRQEEMKDDSTSSNALEKDDEVSTATGAGKNALLSLLSMAEGENNGHVSINALENDDGSSIATGVGKHASMRLLSMAGGNDHDNVTIDAVENDEEVSVGTGAGEHALLSLLSMAGSNGNHNISINALEEDEVSMAAGAGKHALMALLSMADGNNVSELLQDKSVSNDEPLMSNVKISTPDDDASTVSGSGRRALQFVLAQSTNGQGYKSEAKSVQKRSGRKKTPRMLPSQTTTAATKREANNAKTKSPTTNDFYPKNPMRMSWSNKVSKKQREDADTNLENDFEISMSSGTATGLSSDGEFSVAQDGAGKKALASLLSCAKYGELV